MNERTLVDYSWETKPQTSDDLFEYFLLLPYCLVLAWLTYRPLEAGDTLVLVCFLFPCFTNENTDIICSSQFGSSKKPSSPHQDLPSQEFIWKKPSSK
jgi:hypothetical protein